MKFLLPLIIILAGCGSREITNLEQYLSTQDKIIYKISSVEDIKRNFFSTTAYAAIRNIPVIDARCRGAYAAGTTGLSGIYYFITTGKFGRAVVINFSSYESKDFSIVSAIIH